MSKRTGYIMVAGAVLLLFIGVWGDVFPLSVLGLIGLAVGGYFVYAGHMKERQKEVQELGVIIVTTDSIPGKKIVKTHGLVQASSGLQTGGGADSIAEIDARRDLMKEARRLGANAVIGMKTTRQLEGGGVTYNMYGTAVVAEDENGIAREAEHIKQAGDVNYCTSCGGRLADGAMYCSQCGHKIQ